MLFISLLLVSVRLSNTKLTLTWDEWDMLTQDQVVEHGDLVSSTPYDNNCHQVEARVDQYRVLVTNVTHEEVMFVDIFVEDSGEDQKVYSTKDNKVINVTVYKKLNCYEHDDNRLIEAIATKILSPPSIKGEYCIHLEDPLQ